MARLKSVVRQFAIKYLPFYEKKYAESLFLIIIAIIFASVMNKRKVIMYNSLYILNNLNLVVLCG